MSSISSIASFQQVSVSPLDRLKDELSSEVSAGTINAGDQDALTTALNDIDSAIKSSADAAKTNGSGRPAPGEMKAKIDSLIQAEVDKGSLTSDQAKELKNVFSNAFAKGQGGGPGGPGGPGGSGGPGGAGGPADAQSEASTDASSTDSGSQKLLTDFIKLLQDAAGSSASYDASGQSTSVNASLLLDFQG